MRKLIKNENENENTFYCILIQYNNKKKQHLIPIKEIDRPKT